MGKDLPRAQCLRFSWIFQGHCLVSRAAQLSLPARLPEVSVLSHRCPAVPTGQSLNASEDQQRAWQT